MLEKNLSVLLEEYSDLYYKILLKKEELEKSELIIEKDNYNIILENRKVHSVYNPQKEASRWVESIQIKEEINSIFIIGLGLGYYLDELILKFKDKKIIIVEPSLEAFYSMLKIRDITKLLKSPDIVFLVNLDTNSIRSLYDSFIQNNKIKNSFFTELPIYKTIYASYIDEVYNELKKIMLLLKGNVVTNALTAHKWVYNNFRNLKYLAQDLNINIIKDDFKKKPAILVSAGPSLAKHIETLKKLENKALIVAVGTAAAILDKHNVKAHMFMAIDGNKEETTIFKKIQDQSPVLVYAHMLHYQTLELYKGKRLNFLESRNNPFFNLMESMDMEYKDLLCGGTVANIALSLLSYLDCEPIVLVGQDLAFTDKKNHAEGTPHEGNDLSKEDIAKKGLIKTEDIYGKEIYTDELFETYRNWFEDFRSIIDPTRKIYNCTEGGVSIKGIENRKLKDIIDEFFNADINFESILKSKIMIEENNIFSEKDIKNKLEKKFIQYENELKKLNKLSKKRIEMLKELIDKSIVDGKFYQKNLDRALDITEKIEKIEVFDEFIRPVGKQFVDFISNSTANIMQQKESMKEKKKELLNGLLKQYVFYDESIGNAFKGLKNIDIKQYKQVD